MNTGDLLYNFYNKYKCKLTDLPENYNECGQVQKPLKI